MNAVKWGLLGLAALLGYIGPIFVGIYASGAAGNAAVTFPDLAWGLPLVFGVIAAAGAFAPLVLAERQGWL